MTTGPRFDDRLDPAPALGPAEVVRLVRRCLAFLRPVRGLFATKFFLLCGSVIPVLVAPWPIKIIVDHALLARPIDQATSPLPPFMQPFADLLVNATPTTILLASIGLLAVLVLLFGAGDEGKQGTIGYLAQGEDTATQAENLASGGMSRAGGLWGLADLLWHMRLAQNVTHLVRCRLVRGLFRLPMNLLDDNRIGDSVYRVMYDTAAIQGICIDLLLAPVVAVLSALASLYILHYSYGALAPQIIWMGLALFPLTVAATLPLAAPARRASQESRASGSATSNRMEENLTQIVAVQSLGAGASERTRFTSASEESFRYFRHVVAIRVLIGLIVGAISGALLLYLFVTVSNLIVADALSPGDFQVLVSLYLTVAFAAGSLGQVWINLQNNAAAARRVFFFLDQTATDQPAARGAPLRTSARISLEKVSFGYPESMPVLHDIDFAAEPGTMIALAGPTGAGKSTLAHVLAGYYLPTEGRVRFGEVDAREATPEQRDRLVTYVFQEHQLFSTSAFDNIAFGHPAASAEEVERAARLACAHEFIDALPRGYASPLGRDGSQLSTGERARVSLARGLVRNTPVLILDEPTAALDVQTERVLLANLQALRPDHLLIVITHREALAKAADRVLFLEDGRIREQGSHNELMARAGGRYRAWCEANSA